nr:hypothetical protein [Mycolicibacterium komanii]CRL77992.1 hypothetical protein CPGR_04987 [Mycolicibacterium komanii]
MSFDCILKNPVIGKHAPLRLGWSDEQLQPVVEHLQTTLDTSALTSKRLFALASVATSLVVEMMRSGGGLRYARGKDAYRIPKRYRCGDPLFTWHYLTHAMAVLERHALISHATGLWAKGGGGYQSVAWATEQLVDLLEPVVTVSALRAIPTQKETIVLRDGSDKSDIDYVDTVETMRMRMEVGVINGALAELDIYCRGRKVALPVGRRVFNTSFDRGGRFYFHGPSYQNTPAEDRRELRIVVDGSEHPMVEVDYGNLHIQMAYAEARRLPPKGDQYDIEGFDRHLVKVAFNTLLNAPSRNSAIAAITEDLYKQDLQQISLRPLRDRKACRSLATEVVIAIERKHRRIKSHFSSDCGARFQRLDSDMAIRVMLRMIERTGRCPLPMHDSFLVAELDVEALAETMRVVAGENNLRLVLRSSAGQQWTVTRRTASGPTRRQTGSASHPLFHMGVTNPHLPKWQQILQRRCMSRRTVEGYAQRACTRHMTSRGPPALEPIDSGAHEWPQGANASNNQVAQAVPILTLDICRMPTKYQ